MTADPAGTPATHPDLPEVSARWVRMLAWYGPRYVDKNFSAVRLLGDPPDTENPRPLLVYLNHPSWWDPMAIMLLCARYFRHRTGYGPIDAVGLEKYRFMEKLGFFGIDLQSRAGAERFLKIGRAVLSTPNQTLWVTAEGHFTDARKRPVSLRPGVAHLARKADPAIGAEAVPLAIEYVFGEEKQPEMRLAFGEPIVLGDPSRSASDWNTHLANRLEQTMDHLAEASLAGDLSVFTTLGDGKRGVGGVYDLWRRARAALKGEQFDAAHGSRGDAS
ncbi:lysophospholipid acyltransferase family protein [Algisphaera agarilytica]|uniref:1-acyl-sn-glycerol-3-phosphate acyltransferase n=1 Tax=Algisphaera agarilytica TaxID=1385975 RepID=A0A7X0H4K5_9BACT|nr:lysophospholipid acyltransferase family protein [Algisphaera agarilytica]MBB6428968.1 1-acyl-sn-glycerol-3-phosphate acyltransferase [Algisphaera agarilytica]